MDNYNNRQYKLMLQKISLFRQGKIEIPDLIGDLEGLLNALEEPNSNWKNTFQIECGELEQVYAFALYEERDYLNQKDIKVIEKVLDNIILLINEKITIENEFEFEI